MSNGKDKKKSNSPGPHGMHSVTSQHSGEVKVKKRKKAKHIKPKKKKEEYDVEWVKEAGSYDKYLIPKEFRNLYPNKKKKATVAAKRRELRKKLYKKILEKKAPKAVDIAKRKKPRSMKKGGTVKETGIYKLHKGEKVVPVKKKKKTEPKLRPQPEWEMSDFQWVPDRHDAGSYRLRHTESGVKKMRKIATHKAKTEGKKVFPYRPTHKIEKEKNP